MGRHIATRGAGLWMQWACACLSATGVWGCAEAPADLAQSAAGDAATDEYVWPLTDVAAHLDVQADAEAKDEFDGKDASATDAAIDVADAPGDGALDAADDAAAPDVETDLASADAPDVPPAPDAYLLDGPLPDVEVPDSAVSDVALTDVAVPDVIEELPPPVCTDVPPVAAVPLAPLVAKNPGGKTETLTVGNHVDDYLYQADGQLKVGIRRDWGASLVFFGMANVPGMNTSNTLDAHDTGREVQVALYDPARAMQGCAWNASCQTNPAASCPNSIAYLGWDPVQGGNECNIGSPLESVSLTGGVLSAVVRPNHWNPDWQEPTCTTGGCSDPAKQSLLSDVRYTQSLRFVQDNVVEVSMQIDNLSGMDHAATLQEFPTLYAAFGDAGTPNLNVLLDSTGQQVVIDQPANDGNFVKNFQTPGGWATLQNATHDYGVALYNENRLQAFQGWQQAGIFNNFRAQFQFAIPAWGTVRARAYLVIGGFATVQGILTALDKQIPAFGELEAPAPDAAVQTSVDVNGWVLDNGAVTKLEARLDGQVLADLGVNVPRPDVCATWPGYAMCAGLVGFAQTIALPGNLGACGHLLEIVATDSDGNARVIGRSRLFTGGAQPPPPLPIPPSHPIWRFASTQATDHMFGVNQTPLAGYALEGQAFALFDGPGTPAQPVVPLYQRYCASCTDHMPALDPNEGTPDYTGAEVLGYCALSPTPWAKTQLTRLYGAAGSDHFMTADPAEIVATGASGYVPEWSCWGP